ncbi:efflux RND transporter periplasmic adaptor subunit [Hyphomonas sp. WL0036]|uniref:efflux RND transporter periplasmic adaptor subunit n=1 Tax=Hyphomonas sediminis TaxID=2866160 RepID=UPI001C8189B6|nr:efflux RND transporter periplasmic adaptor subunit [Hyphomonas sediminis]MBY9068036.1 efflux RND transporter periplasmic adaptor subunit [Hyphomonas sediminis]
MSDKFKILALAIPLSLTLAACGPGSVKQGQNGDKSGQTESIRDDSGHSEDDHDHDEDHDDGHGHGHEEGGDHVELSARAAAEAGIVVDTASLAPLASTLKLPAEIRFDADRIANVSASIEGIVARVAASEGASVRKGETLAVLNSRELAGLKADYLTAVSAESLARDTLMREQKLWDQKITAEADLQAAKASVATAEANRKAAENKLHAVGVSHGALEKMMDAPDGALASVAISAPIGGKVVRRNIFLGETVSAGGGTPLFIIADDSVLWADIAVYKNDYARLREGMAVTLRHENGAVAGEGKINLILPLIDEASRTATARVILDNKDGHLRPGQFVTAEIAAGEAANVVRVPENAIVIVEGKPSVFIPTDDGFSPRAVTPGGKAGGFAEIRSGLETGERYVSEGAFTLKAQLEKDAFGDGHAH